jgi:NAD(P)-dependent dehydrogenase (short-subunit alcohol dehydrogenase family)/acyl carrier protein
LLTARWLAEKGAGAIVLMGRQSPQGDALRAMAEMRATGTTVVAVQGDAGCEEDIRRVLGDIAAQLPPLRGLFHAAGLLDNGAMLNLTLPQFDTVLTPKAYASWLLHSHTKGLALDYFVLYSSIASLFGAAGQANHAAANTFMDMLAQRRAAEGLPALSINWGAWGEVGSVMAYDAEKLLNSQGIGIMSPTDGLAVLEYLLRQPASQVAVSPMDWPKFVSQYTGTPRYFHEMMARNSNVNDGHSRPKTATQPLTVADSFVTQLAEATPSRRQTMLVTLILEQAAHVLGLQPENVSEELPLSDYGLDSLMAVELRNLIGQGLGVKRSLPATLVFDYPTIDEISQYLLRNVLALGSQESQAHEPEVTTQAGNATTMDAMSALEHLSDDEVDRLFAQLGISDDE